MKPSSSALAWVAARMELGRVGDAANLRPMEGLRGFAVAMVFLVHYASLVEPWTLERSAWSQLLSWGHAIGNAGVDLFFVLSGFLIYGGLVERRRPFVDYLQRRLRRIYPVFLVVFVLYVVLSLARGGGRIPDDPADALVYLLQNLLLLPGLLPIEPLITVAWSLSYEFFCYLLLPLLVAVLGLRARTRVWRLWLYGLLTLAGFALFARFGGPERLMLFLAGMLLHELLRLGHGPRLGHWPAALAALAALLSMLLPLSGSVGLATRAALLFIGFGLLCWACFGRPEAGLGRIFSWTPLRWLGNMSYSYYLIHGLALQAFFALIGAWLPSGQELGGWLLLPAFAATLPPALLLFLFVERPFSLVTAQRTKPAAPGA